MANSRMQFMEDLEEIRNLTSSDFAALALCLDKAKSYRWKCAAGNSNDRYQHMVIRTGQGLAGTALRLGRWVKLDDSHPQFGRERRDCPVMLAEQLQAAAVFPIRLDTGCPMRGLLFIGKRKGTRYEEDEIRTAQENLHKLVSDMKEYQEEMRI
ncbi:GAF domain-containing protein [Paenibacillus roseipurpureus]|uniref:GAF domain-containing protein n=1 Tax=Paenibacillus roseopurpureus TaxID=2918901 RepID=A0AA96LM04_9BACL|nr:GAF domain-containing protein [Paenibacillus sp. MBLB1832]WNR44220.1 GAF domain-containing protein [Paenibacillus sp. MBLB1832]